MVMFYLTLLGNSTLTLSWKSRSKKYVKCRSI